MTATAAPEHLLTVVESTPDADTTLDLARDHVAKGGTAQVVLMVSKRLQREIDDFARAANLPRGEAEEIVLGRLRYDLERQVGPGTVATALHGHRGTVELGRYVTPTTTAIALPRRLSERRSVRRSTAATGLPVVVAPNRAA